MTGRSSYRRTARRIEGGTVWVWASAAPSRRSARRGAAERRSNDGVQTENLPCCRCSGHRSWVRWFGSSDYQRRSHWRCAGHSLRVPSQTGNRRFRIALSQLRTPTRRVQAGARGSTWNFLRLPFRRHPTNRRGGADVPGWNSLPQSTGPLLHLPVTLGRSTCVRRFEVSAAGSVRASTWGSHIVFLYDGKPAQ